MYSKPQVIDSGGGKPALMVELPFYGKRVIDTHDSYKEFSTRDYNLIVRFVAKQVDSEFPKTGIGANGIQEVLSELKVVYQQSNNTEVAWMKGFLTGLPLLVLERLAVVLDKWCLDSLSSELRRYFLGAEYRETLNLGFVNSPRLITGSKRQQVDRINLPSGGMLMIEVPEPTDTLQ
jgi:hypothetical protein